MVLGSALWRARLRRPLCALLRVRVKLRQVSISWLGLLLLRLLLGIAIRGTVCGRSRVTCVLLLLRRNSLAVSTVDLTSELLAKRTRWLER